MIIYDINSIFRTPTHLHVICWNIYNIQKHIAGLQLLKELLDDAQLKEFLLPMIRPLGRTNMSFYEDAAEMHGDLGARGIDFDKLNSHYSHCELWIQTSAEHEKEVWGKLVSWIDKYKHGFARRSLVNGIWRPFSDDLTAGHNFHPRFGEEIKKKSYPSTLDKMVSVEGIPKFIKYVWARASEVIIEKANLNGQIQLFDPNTATSLFDKLLKDVVTEFDLMKTGIVNFSTKIDPKQYGISHMPTFAVSAITSTRPDYQIEHFLGPRSTHPYTW